jgi:hypothetical protein
MNENASTPVTAPDKFSARRDADNRAYVADVLGMPRPVWVSTPRAFRADEPSRASTVPSRKPVTRSHRHHSEVK